MKAFVLSLVSAGAIIDAFQHPVSSITAIASPSQRNDHNTRSSFTLLQAAISDDKNNAPSTSSTSYHTRQSPFSLPTALFLAGLAFNAYTEPPPDSSRWERGSSGLNVAFLSPTYTRSLYSGIVEVTPLKASDLPDDDDGAERVMSGSGVDATLLVGVVEGAWKEDVDKLEKEQFHNGYVIVICVAICCIYCDGHF